MLELVLPHALVQARRHRAELERLGVAPRLARRWGRSPAKVRALHTSRATLLPDGALAHLHTVVDVGANVGRWSQAVLELCEPDRLLAIDPQPGVQDALHAALAHRPGVEVVAAAVGAAPGTTSLHVTRHRDNASLLDPRAGEMLAHYGPGFEVLEQVDVPVRTLDDLTGGFEHIDLLKIDVQGYERQVLAGASAALPRTQHVLLEVTFRSHYVGDSSFAELHALMEAAGFTLANLAQPWARGGVALWSDALYSRSP